MGIHHRQPGNRLELITHLLKHVKKNAFDHNAANEILKRIQARMDLRPREVRNPYVSRDEALRRGSGGNGDPAGRSPEDLLKIIADSEPRSGKIEIRHIRLNPDKDFTDTDFAAIAEYFEISTLEAQEIIQLFQNCFDSRGSFLKTAFEKNVPRFARHEKKIFEILWEFLKETSRRSNRLPFLNSLQFLVAETQQPIQVIKVLLADFTRHPESVYYPDRNAVMLLNQLLRAYNKESIVDIESTPEEVLRVKGGLQKNVVNYVVWKVDEDQKAFPDKIAAIRKRLFEAMEPDPSEAQLLPARFLLALEREIHIFLALIGGRTAVEVMRSALKVYGNPASPVYHLKKSPSQKEPLLLHLAALIRGFGRLGCSADMSLLDDIKLGQDQFARWHAHTRYQTLVRRVMGLIDESRAAISTRTD